MKKSLLLLLILFPAFAFSQDLDFSNKDIAKKTLGIASSFKFNDHVGVFQIRLNDTTFELVAVDDYSQLLWRASYEGYGVACGKFNNHILAISSAGHTKSKWSINPYKAYLIDEKTGKLIIQNVIFDKIPLHQESVEVYFKSDGTQFRLVARQTHYRSGAFSYFQDKTEEINIISLDENLKAKIVKPRIPDGDFANMTFNSNGDFYFLTGRNNTLKAWRYEDGNTEPAEPISLEFNAVQPIGFSNGAITASEVNRNLLYLGITYNNNNDDRVLLTGKFDFDKRSLQVDSEVFTGSHKRSLEKSYVPFKDNPLKPNIGAQKSTLEVNYIKEHDNKLVVVLSESFFGNNSFSSAFYGRSLIINYYDDGLKKLFQQLMPVEYQWSERLNSDFRLENHVLNIVSNNQSLYSFSLYGQLDMTTGNWLKLNNLAMASSFAANDHIIWFKDSFIIPFLGQSAFFSSKYNVRLQGHTY